jgi:hypothetical protein
MNTHIYILSLWAHLKYWADLILRLMNLNTKSISLSTETSSTTKRIISCKYNTHIKFGILIHIRALTPINTHMHTLPVTSQDSNSCNRTLIVDVIQHLNQIGTNSIKFDSNSKTRTELYFSFEMYWSLVKVFNTKVVPNTLIYIKNHIFLRPLSTFLIFYQVLC